MERTTAIGMMAAIIFAGRENLKPGEAAHFASQLMDSVEARSARNAPNWVAAAAAVLTDGNKEQETTPEPASEEPSAEKTDVSEEE
tara:strand:+ start:197 stop:454 length:258 start_codon:yes stop_codon:yes gene_type:complete